jgi:hypothetical protein
MHKVAGLLTLIFVLPQCGATALAQTCEYAGQTFSLGATICECPNLRIVRSANSAGRGEITSRRLACSKDQTWVNTNSLCLVAYTSADHAEDAFRKFQVSYCPRLPVNHAELLKAISEETEKFFSLAPRSQVLVAVEAICRRYADLSEPCKTMIETLAATGNSATGNSATGNSATGNSATGNSATGN